MHRCLQTPEIVLYIVQHASRLQKTLVALALTCRAFENIALSKIWEGPDASGGVFEKILGCLPPDLLEVSVVSGELSARLRRPVRRGDWERPSVSCARVRHVSLPYASAPRYASMLSLFATIFPGQVIFPRLQTLFWDMSHPETKERQAELVGFIRLLISPTIQSLHLEKASDGLPLMLSILPTITTGARLLTELDLGPGPLCGCSFDERAAISDFVLSLDHLKSLSAPTIDGRAWLHLAGLRGLHSLILQACPEDLQALPHVSETSFRDLEDLSIGGVSLRAPLGFLPFIENTPLQNLDLAPAFSTTPDELETFYASLADTPSLTATLERLCQELPELPRGTVARHGWGVPRAVLKTLARFTALTSVCLHSFRPFDIDETLLLQLAHNWPEIRVLHLSQCSSESRLPLKALLGLAFFCPDLQDIDITFDTANIPSLRAVALDDPQRPVLEQLAQLSLGYSSLEDTQVFDMARFISGLCPQVVYITSQGLRNRSRWGDVSDLARKLREIREEETEWALMYYDEGDGEEDEEEDVDEEEGEEEAGANAESNEMRG